MNFDDWVKDFIGFVTAHLPTHHYYKEYQELLCGMHERMIKAPAQIHNQYNLINDTEIQHAAKKWESTLIELKAVVWSMGDDRSLALQIGSFLRACDALIARQRNYSGPIGVEDWVIGDWYVIPRKAPVAWREPKVGATYLRRGLKHNRVVPRFVDGMAVELVLLEGPRRKSGPPRTSFGAAVFNDVKLKIKKEKGSGGFIATGVSFANEKTAIASHFIDIARSNCFSVVWPELTVPPKIRKKIEEALLGSPDTAPELSVAGSWHEKIGKDVFNVSNIYDRFGEVIAQHQKFVPFHELDLGEELITCGRKFYVFVTDEYILSVAICKDFCGMSGKYPYQELNLDLVLVPSMSTQSGMESHQTVAKSIRHPVGTRTVVVQQMEKMLADNTHAMLLDPKPDPLRGLVRLSKGETWRSFDGL